jgi:hypothetical protein
MHVSELLNMHKVVESILIKNLSNMYKSKIRAEIINDFGNLFITVSI